MRQSQFLITAPVEDGVLLFHTDPFLSSPPCLCFVTELHGKFPNLLPKYLSCLNWQPLFRAVRPAISKCIASDDFRKTRAENGNRMRSQEY